MSVPSENSEGTTTAAPGLPREVMVVDHWLIFDCPRCQQKIKLDRKDGVHPLECPSCGAGFEPLLARTVKLPTRTRRRRGARVSDRPRRESSVGSGNSIHRMTPDSLPREGVVQLTLVPSAPAAAASPEPGETSEANASRLPVRSALELERRRVEALETTPVQPDESELNAVIEKQSGGQYKRIRVRTRKKRLTEKQRLTKWMAFVGLAALLIVGLSLWGASLLYQSDDDALGARASAQKITPLGDSDPIGPSIETRESLVTQVMNARTVEELLNLIRFPKRLEDTVRQYYGDEPLPKLAVKSIATMSGKEDSLPRNFSRYQAILESAIMPLYIEDTDSHGYRLDWESFVGLGEVPWDQFVNEKRTSTTRMRVYLSKGGYYQEPFMEQRYQCLRIEDPSRTHTIYGYYDRNQLAFTKLTEIFLATGSNVGVTLDAAGNAEIRALVDIRFPAGITTPQVELVKLVNDSWLHR